MINYGDYIARWEYGPIYEGIAVAPYSVLVGYGWMLRCYRQGIT